MENKHFNSHTDTQNDQPFLDPAPREYKELYGIGGWLLTFTILHVLEILGKLVNLGGIGELKDTAPMVVKQLGGTSQTISELNALLDTISIFGVITLLGSVVVLVLLLVKSRHFVKSWLIVTLLSYGVSIYFLSKLSSLITIGPYAGEGIGQLFISICINFAWFAYFMSSKRVKNTFYSVEM